MAEAGLKQVTVFTDGSCDTGSGRGGWAYLLKHGTKSKQASGFEANTTNNRMELTAAVKALEALTQRSSVSIVTDSEYLKKAFTDGWLTRWQANGWRTAGRQSVKNQDLWQRLIELESRHVVSWTWTKGHAGHAENELVDTLALTARRSGVGVG